MSTPSPDVFEKLASFYLGRHYDLAAGELKEDLLMYDAKDLCTHAMCVGMTGSGKTGLCLSLLEEAAIDGIPAICIDPKGDLANLMLSFPDMKPADFRPWLEQGEATRKGMTLDEFADSTAAKWKSGLASWGQTPDRVQKFKDAADVNVYTPGGNTGIPLTVLKSFDAPPAAVLADTDAMRERVTGAASGLLTLMGVEADPLLSREHILISSIFDHAWREGRSVSIGDLIGLIQSPPITRVGVLDLDTFMSSSDRSKLAMRLNNLLASPAFASWLEGEPLSIQKLLYTPEGKPKLTILSIAHLSDSERMFFVTILLNELVAWMRTQSGTSSLRALLYMDEVAGYFPPVSNPPSKPPMLTLLKQARAFGLGVTLATQNPVDLDYKGLSNIGTWFLGRLQTERDKARVLDGLEGAAVQSGQTFDKAAMGRLLASLGNRVFLMNNVHDDGPTVFQTRWAMSFLAGPLARDQISDLMKDKKAAIAADRQSAGETIDDEPTAPSRPVVPAGIDEQFVLPAIRPAAGVKCVYRPALYAKGSLHFVRASADLDQWIDQRRIVGCGAGVPDDTWEASQQVSPDIEFSSQADEQYIFGALPDDLVSASKVKSQEKKFKEYLYRHHSMTLYKSTELKQYAPGGSSEAEARVYFTQACREALDLAKEKLRVKYNAKLASVEKKIRTAEERVEREKGQANQAWLAPIVSIGSTLLSSFLGQRRGRRSSSTVVREFGRANQQHGDVKRAEQSVEDLNIDWQEIEDELKREMEKLARQFRVENLELDETVIPPRKSDLKTSTPVITWCPWQVDATGIATPLY